MKLHELKPIFGRKKKRVGRGSGSSRGTYSGRGQKGQNSRSGAKTPKSTLVAKLPKLRGEKFRHVKRKKIAVVNLRDLEKYYKKGEEISKKSLMEHKIIIEKKSQPISKIKILGQGKLTKKLKFATDLIYSKKAKEQIDNV